MFKDDTIVHYLSVSGKDKAFIVLNKFYISEFDKKILNDLVKDEQYRSFLESNDVLYIDDVVSHVPKGLNLMINTLPYYPEFIAFHGRLSNMAYIKIKIALYERGYDLIYSCYVPNHLGGEAFQFAILKKLKK